MMRCSACKKDRPSSWQLGAGNIANPPQGPQCECGCNQFIMTIGQQPPQREALTRDEIIEIARRHVVLNGSHEMCDYVGFAREIAERAAALVTAHHIGSGYSILTCPFCVRTVHFMYKEDSHG